MVELASATLGSPITHYTRRCRPAVGRKWEEERPLDIRDVVATKV